MKGKNKTKILLAVLCGILALLIGGISIVIVNGKMKEQKYQENISSAQKYLAQGDYDRAEKALKEAISINPEETDAYLELADLYVEMAEKSKALSILRKGYEVTGSAKIKRRMSQIEGNQITTMASGGSKGITNTANLDLSTVSQDIAWNTSFLQKLANYTYADYADEYGSSPSAVRDSQGYLEVEHRGLNAVCYYKNTVDNKEIVDESRKIPDTNGMPEKVTLNSLELIFRNFEGGVSLERMQMLFGEKVQPKSSAGRTYIEKKMEDYIIRIETDEMGNVVSADAWNEILLPNANLKKNSAGHVSGVIVDAISGDGVSGAQLNFEPVNYNGKSNSTATNSLGTFSVDLEPGNYRVSISAKDYITEEFTIEIEEGKTYSGLQFTISPELSSGTARIVLEWNAQPQDLDSYLDGRTDNGTDVHVNFTQKQVSAGGKTIAELDLDDTNGYGPETTTIYDLNGVYTFTVVDFRTTGTMADYGATVKVYLPGQSVQVITLSAGSAVENVWEVCTIDHGELKVLNRVPAGEDFTEGNK